MKAKRTFDAVYQEIMASMPTQRRDVPQSGRENGIGSQSLKGNLEVKNEQEKKQVFERAPKVGQSRMLSNNLYNYPKHLVSFYTLILKNQILDDYAKKDAESDWKHQYQIACDEAFAKMYQLSFDRHDAEEDQVREVEIASMRQGTQILSKSTAQIRTQTQGQVQTQHSIGASTYPARRLEQKLVVEKPIVTAQNLPGTTNAPVAQFAAGLSEPAPVPPKPQLASISKPQSLPATIVQTDTSKLRVGPTINPQATVTLKPQAVVQTNAQPQVAPKSQVAVAPKSQVAVAPKSQVAVAPKSQVAVAPKPQVAVAPKLQVAAPTNQQPLVTQVQAMIFQGPNPNNVLNGTTQNRLGTNTASLPIRAHARVNTVSNLIPQPMNGGNAINSVNGGGNASGSGSGSSVASNAQPIQRISRVDSKPTNIRQ